MKKMYKKILSLTIILMLLVQLIPISVVQASTDFYMKASQLPYSNKFVDLIDEGGKTYVALDEKGDIWTWGSNFNGIFGDGSDYRGYRELPKKLEVETKFKQISGGACWFWVALDVNGNVWGCGLNNQSPLGNGVESTSTTPNFVEDTLFQITSGTKFTKVEAGYNSVLALDEDGNIWGWGENRYGKLMNGGKGTYTYSYSDSSTQEIITRPLKLTTGKKYIDISVDKDGSEVAAAIDENNNLYVWGSNAHCQLARDRGSNSDGTAFFSSNTQVQVKSGTEFSKVSVGGAYVAALDLEGNLYRWGSISSLGISESSASRLEGYDSNVKALYEPVIKTDAKFVDIQSGPNVGYAKAADNQYAAVNNKYFVWGDNRWGGFGASTDERGEQIPLELSGSEWIDGLSKYRVIKEGLALDESGYMWRWGFEYKNSEGSTVRALDPIQITGEKSYTVTFKDGDTVLDTQTVASGGSATAPANPTKTGYTFAGWDKPFTNVTSDLEVNAKWTQNKYTVTFKDGDTVLDTQEVTHGGSATAPANPTKTGYTFAGWDKPFTNVTSDLEVNAKWTQNKYTVTFKDGDTVLDTQEVTHGGSATAPEAPEKVGHTFTGWDKPFTNVTSNLEVSAQWRVNTYNVTLNPNEGTIPEGENVTSYTYGVGATLPTPTRTGYTFAGWYINQDLTGDAIHTIGTEATGDKTYYAKWEEGTGTSYKVEHYKQNLTTNTYEKVATDDLTAKTGLTVTATPKAYEGYTENQTHGDRVASGVVSADGSLVLKLYYDVNQYTVTFKNEDTVLKEETVAHGQAAVAPGTPVREGYTFTGWDKDFSNVTNNLTVKAIWTVSTYKVTLNTNGGIIPEGQNITNYTYGVGATLPTPARVGYTFAGWYRTEDLTGDAITNIGTLATGDKTYYAKWNKNQYTVTFVSDGQTLSTQNIAHGANAIAPTAPTKEGYTFAGWDKPFTNVTSDLEVNAKWTQNQEEPKQVGYKVEHYKQNIKTNTYEKVATDELTGTTGSTVTAVAKTYEGFHENTSHGDRVATGVVVEDGSLVLKLYYDINQYKVTFKDGDKVVKEETVAHGGSATPPTITKPGYILSWDKSTDNITGDTTFTAVWTKDPNYVDPNANDGKEEKPSFLPQTGESYIVVGMISVVMSVAVLVYLKYRKIGE